MIKPFRNYTPEIDATLAPWPPQDWNLPITSDPFLVSARVKLDLFCNGLRLSKEFRADLEKNLHRVRAGLGSGIELRLPGEVYVNAPVEEDFAGESVWTLDGTAAEPVLAHIGGSRWPAELFACEEFYSKTTSSGMPMRAVGTLQGTYLGVYLGPVCHHWTRQTGGPCRFCAVGLNVKDAPAPTVSPQDLKEALLLAREMYGVTFVHINTGHMEDMSYLDMIQPYVRAAASEGFLVGVQCPPHPDRSHYEKLSKMGVQNVSFCFEFWSPEAFKDLCPGKAAVYGHDGYFSAIQDCTKLFHTVNGEMVAGPEPEAATLEAIDNLTSWGAIPTVCVFRPLKGTAMADAPVPKFSDMARIYAHLYRRCTEQNLPIGCAPNVKVSIVPLPEEGRAFMEDPDAFPMRRAQRAVKRTAFKWAFQLGLHKVRETTGEPPA